MFFISFTLTSHFYQVASKFKFVKTSWYWKSLLYLQICSNFNFYIILLFLQKKLLIVAIRNDLSLVANVYMSYLIALCFYFGKLTMSTLYWQKCKLKQFTIKFHNQAINNFNCKHWNKKLSKSEMSYYIFNNSNSE